MLLIHYQFHFQSDLDSDDFSFKTVKTNKRRELYLQDGKRFDLRHLHQCSRIRFAFEII